jgi:hypothetical protein
MGRAVLLKSRNGTIIDFMRVIALSTLKAFWSSSSAYSDSIEPGMAWYRETLKALLSHKQLKKKA